MGGEKDSDKELEQIRKKKMEELLERKSDSKSSPEYPDSPITATDASLDELANRYPLLVVDCWAEWCAPCGPMGTIIEDLAKEFSGQIAFGKLNVDENRQTAIRYQISSIPQLLVFRNGKEIDRIVGLQPKDAIASKLREYLH